MATTTTLTKAERAAWAARLRDPRSKQARGTLRDADGGFCCLGHGCIVMGKTIARTNINCDDAYHFIATKHDRYNEYFMHLNDIKRMSLPEIANIIDTLPTCD